jgi:Putative zinc-finger
MPSEPRVPTEPTLEELSAFIDSELDAAEQARVAEHVAGCADCQARLDGLRQTAHAVRALPMESPPRTFTIPEARRPSFRWAPVGWLGTGAAAMLVIVLGVTQLHVQGPASTASSSTVSGGLGQGNAYLTRKAVAPVAAPAPPTNDQFSGQATSLAANGATAADQTNGRRLMLSTDRAAYSINGQMRVTIELQGSPSTSTNSGDQGLTLTLVRDGTGVALNPVGVSSYNGTPVFGGTYDLSNLPLASPRAGDYRLEATWVVPDGSGRLLQAVVPVQLTGS